MPILEMNFSVFLLWRNEKVPVRDVLGYKRNLLNVPIQNFGEEHVKRYADRFGSC